MRSFRVVMVLALGVCLNSALDIKKTKVKHPIIIVPGDGGSQIEAKLTDASTLPWYCWKNTKHFSSYWVNIWKMIIPIFQRCFFDSFELVYDEENNVYSNVKGVETRVPGWGDTESVEYLNPGLLKGLVEYFHPFVEELVTKHNYVRNISIRAAPYDFRYSPENIPLIENLARLVEETYKINGNKQVYIAAHSLGNFVIHGLLMEKSQEWKDKYIKAYIAMAPPLGGSVQVLRAVSAGIHFIKKLKIIPEKIYKDCSRTFASTYQIIPHQSCWEKYVFAITDKRNYTVMDYQDWFSDIRYPQGWKMRQRALLTMHERDAPKVEVYNLHGKDIKTELLYDWRDLSFPDDDPKITYGDGDGTVNLRSLRFTDGWKEDNLPHGVHRTEFPGVTHSGMLKDPNVIKHFVEIVTK